MHVVRINNVVLHGIFVGPPSSEKTSKLVTEDIIGVPHAVYRHDYQWVISNFSHRDIFHPPRHSHDYNEVNICEDFQPEPESVLLFVVQAHQLIVVEESCYRPNDNDAVDVEGASLFLLHFSWLFQHIIFLFLFYPIPICPAISLLLFY